MFRSLRHPDFRALNRYVDGELSERERARVAAHLARCFRCRRTVEELRALSAAARELPTPAAPSDLMDLALQRRADGERVILPLTPPGAPPRRSFALLIAIAAIALLALAIVLTLRVPSLEAARGGLTITPDRPTAGARLSFDYQDMGRFQGQQELTVRARYRTPDRRYQLTAGVLERATDGHYRGTITLPDSVVYAAFAVEDAAGRIVDSNDRRLWDVTVHAPDGRPTFDALFARMNDLLSRNWEGAFAVARRMTKLYPDRPASWSSLEMFEASVLEDSTVLPRHRQRLSEMADRILANDRDDPEAMAELAYYAFVLGQQERSRSLIAALHANGGWNRVRLGLRVSMTQIETYNGSSYLSALDSLWNATGGSFSLASAGYAASLHAASLNAANPSVTWTWYQRRAAAEPDEATIMLVQDLLPIPAMRTRVIGALERTLEQGRRADDEDRPLYLSVTEYDRHEGRVAGRARMALGTALLDEGRTVQGVSQVRQAVGSVWTPDLLHRAGRILLQHGDTADAVRAYARMAADPALSLGLRHAIDNDLGALTRTDRWKTAVASARSALTDDVFGARINVRVDTDLVLGRPDGRVVPLSQLMSPGATAVVFWNRLCLPAMVALPAIEQVRRRLQAHGIRMIVIGTEPLSAERERALARMDVPFPVYADRKGEATKEFVPPGTPSYYVLDGEGRIRFAYSNLDRLVTQAVMLRNASGTPASAAE